MVDNIKKTTPLDGDDKWIFTKDTLYEFTINFNDKYQYPFDKERTKKCHHLLESILESIPGTLYNLQMEISMNQYADKYTNPISRIHFHGFIKFFNEGVLNFTIVGHNQLTCIGRFQFNPARPEYWQKYMIKHKHIFNYISHELFNIRKKDIIMDREPEPKDLKKRKRNFETQNAKKENSFFLLPSPSDTDELDTNKERSVTIL